MAAGADRVLGAKTVTACCSPRKGPPSWGEGMREDLVLPLRCWTARDVPHHVCRTRLAAVGRLPTLQTFRVPQMIRTVEFGQLANFSSSFVTCTAKGEDRGCGLAAGRRLPRGPSAALSWWDMECFSRPSLTENSKLFVVTSSQPAWSAALTPGERP